MLETGCRTSCEARAGGNVGDDRSGIARATDAGFQMHVWLAGLGTARN
jgi:hypothetical protein